MIVIVVVGRRTWSGWKLIVGTCRAGCCDAVVCLPSLRWLCWRWWILLMMILMVVMWHWRRWNSCLSNCGSAKLYSMLIKLDILFVGLVNYLARRACTSMRFIWGMARNFGGSRLLQKERIIQWMKRRIVFFSSYLTHSFSVVAMVMNYVRWEMLHSSLSLDSLIFGVTLAIVRIWSPCHGSWVQFHHHWVSRWLARIVGEVHSCYHRNDCNCCAIFPYCQQETGEVDNIAILYQWILRVLSTVDRVHHVGSFSIGFESCHAILSTWLWLFSLIWK